MNASLLTASEQALLGLDEAQIPPDTAGSVFRIAVESQAHFALFHPNKANFSQVQWGQLSGALRRKQAVNALSRPAVGDFVLATPLDEGAFRIDDVLPRRTTLARKSPKRPLPQLLATNVDYVCIVTSPNADFNPRRLERYLAAVYASGAEPVVVMNKCDLEGTDLFVAEAKDIAVGCEIVSTSAQNGTGIEPLRALLRSKSRATTAAFIGSSGVGKSSLTNRLLGYERQSVRETRQDDKGRHTTTHRELFALPHPENRPASYVIDTPGMRSFGLWIEEESLHLAFPEIMETALQCRFQDCKHQQEPGCAVRDAVNKKSIDPARLRSFLHLRFEIEGRKPAP